MTKYHFLSFVFWGLFFSAAFAQNGKWPSVNIKTKVSKDSGGLKLSDVIVMPVVKGEVWKDVNGNLINAHGAGILFYEGIYYLYGEIKKGKTWLVPQQNWEDYRVPAGGVSCYSSKDLVHWAYRGVALSSVISGGSHDLDTGRVMERPKVIYNPVTRKFVMWLHVDKNDYSYAKAGVAVSNRPEGPYQYISSVRPNGQMSRDMTLFQDDNGKAYLIYTSEDNNTMHICLLTRDYLSPSPTYIRILEGQRREAPAMFKHSGKYYLITSLCSGWDANAATYAVADSILGEWKQKGNPCIGPHADVTFYGQSTFVLPINGQRNALLFLADRWNKTNLEDSRYLWLPLHVENGKVQIKWEPE